MSPMDRVDATLRNIDSALAACEPQIERAKALLPSEEGPELEVPVDAPSSAAPPGPFRRFYASWLRVWRRLVWLMCLEWAPELRPIPTGKGVDVIVDAPVVTSGPGEFSPSDFRD